LSGTSQAVFISYASQDADAASRICEALNEAGIEVWFDCSELRGGDAWDERIRREIRDCALFIPVISANTAARAEGYFRLEWSLAEQRSQMIARNKAFIVPVCLDRTPDSGADVPESFRRVQWTRLPEGDTPSAFTTRIAALLTASRSAASSAIPSVLESASLVGQRIRHTVFGAIILLGLAAVVWESARRHPAAVSAVVPTAPVRVPEKSVAVLPFVDTVTGRTLWR
jgi:TIR domain